MSYINAKKRLPLDVIELIQEYIEGEYIYIPKKEKNKKAWGENTDTRLELAARNAEIFEKYNKGITVKSLAQDYFLSEKSIQRIVLSKKKENMITKELKLKAL